jgi:polyhydroxyalkanoate synthesis regulator phasin
MDNPVIPAPHLLRQAEDIEAEYGTDLPVGFEELAIYRRGQASALRELAGKYQPVIPAPQPCSICGDPKPHWHHTVIPAQGDAETLQERAEKWLEATEWMLPSNIAASAPKYVCELLAESRRLAGEVAPLQQQIRSLERTIVTIQTDLQAAEGEVASLREQLKDHA